MAALQVRHDRQQHFAIPSGTYGESYERRRRPAAVYQGMPGILAVLILLPSLGGESHGACRSRACNFGRATREEITYDE